MTDPEVLKAQGRQLATNHLLSSLLEQLVRKDLFTNDDLHKMFVKPVPPLSQEVMSGYDEQYAQFHQELLPRLMRQIPREKSDSDR